MTKWTGELLLSLLRHLAPWQREFGTAGEQAPSRKLACQAAACQQVGIVGSWVREVVRSKCISMVQTLYQALQISVSLGTCI